MTTLEKKVREIRLNAGLLQFFAIFLALSWLFYTLYSNYFLEWKVFNPYTNFCVSISKYILELTGEQIELVRLSNGYLAGLHTPDGAYVRFTQGADGIMFMAILTAAIIAWPGSWLKKCLAIISSVMLVFALNIARVCILLKIDVYFARQFDLMNEWIMPGLMTIAAIGLFAMWVKVSGEHPYDRAASS